MTEIEIVTFDPKYSDAFAELNYAWIKTYFSIEEEDHRSLDHLRLCYTPRGRDILSAEGRSSDRNSGYGPSQSQKD